MTASPEVLARGGRIAERSFRPLFFALLLITAQVRGGEPDALAALAARVAEVTAQLPGAGFTVVVEAPFVVVGDEAAATVRRQAATTVRWAGKQLRQDFFAADPDRVYAIWLFKDATSYEANALKLFGAKPISPYGYCSSAQAALVMNIATGGGTLVHEMVHAYMRGNIADCPTWINEGLASLFEASAEKDGHIVGLVNWRLPGLQEALAKDAKAVPGFAALAALSDEDFYHGQRGANYAAARYLMYWLQERGLLHRFWKEFLAGRAADPSGLTALRAVLGEDLGPPEAQWRVFVRDLR